jgi:hypothetical protein
MAARPAAGLALDRSRKLRPVRYQRRRVAPIQLAVPGLRPRKRVVRRADADDRATFAMLNSARRMLAGGELRVPLDS